MKTVTPTDSDHRLRRRAEPWWFRVVKFSVCIAGAWYLRHTKWFYPWIIGALAGGVGLYWLARKMTKDWTRSWLWWNRK
jgi:hypothetical protein